MMLLIRIVAQLIDLFIGFVIILITFTIILPFLSAYIGNSVVLAVLGIGIIILLLLAVQYPFMVNQQSLGKGFFSLKIVSTDKTRKITMGIIIQREILCKLMSCYFICLPLFFGKAGGHEEATRTEVVRTIRRMR